MDSVLDSLDKETKTKIFQDNFAKLEAASAIDLDVLSVCIQLLAPLDRASSAVTECRGPHEQLWTLVKSYLELDQEQGQDCLYSLAEICLSSASFAVHLATQIDTLLTYFLKVQDDTNKVIPYLKFLMCSYWLPKERRHLINPKSIILLSGFIGIDGIDDIAHDTLSALLSLLKSGRNISIAHEDLWKDHSTNRSRVQIKSIIDQSLWLRLKDLEPKHFTSSSSKVFRTWFQWISLVVTDEVEISCIYNDLYWDRLRRGLLHGFADQRKYCLGIIRQSLRAAHNDIFTPTMQYRNSNRDTYLEAYQKFSSLFETIVLNRYTKQVEACLPELTTLCGAHSVMTSKMVTTLLTAALDSKIQEGVRKMIGNWYIKHIINHQLNFLTGVHAKFLIEGLLPWATEGNLFTSTLTSTRATTVCTHGVALIDVISKFVSNTFDVELSNTKVDSGASHVLVRDPRLRTLILGVIRFISDAEGRIFQPAILYILEGLITGLKALPENESLHSCLEPAEIVEIINLSRLTGLPEIMSDLYSLYCAQLCELVTPDWTSLTLPGCAALYARVLKLHKPVDQGTSSTPSSVCIDKMMALQWFLKDLQESKHKSIQGTAYAPACNSLVKLLDGSDPDSVDQCDLYDVLEALWEEAERREFTRSVAIYLPSLLFHPVCIQVCVLHPMEPNGEHARSLKGLLTRAISRLQILSKGRIYIVSTLAKSIRKAVLTDISILDVLPIEDFIVDFVNNPPSIRPEFLFEVVAAEKIQQILPHRTFTSYYGQREWQAYAAIIDLLQRLPEDGKSAGQRILDRLLEPWNNQQPPVPIKSPWKQTMQLQVMLVLSDYCITESETDKYLDTFTKILVLEPWPRYRYLLEWIVARIYCWSQHKVSQISDALNSLVEYSPIHIASLLKLGLLVAPFESEDFAAKLATHLTCFSASPKVQIRHEANFVFPLLFDLAEKKNWKSIIDNPALKGLNTFIRGLDKFNASPWTIRTLRLDARDDFTLANIFQGPYLSIESPEPERVTYEDFITLQAESDVACLPAARIALGKPNVTEVIRHTPAAAPLALPSAETSSSSIQTFLQTKAGFDLNSLHPYNGRSSKQNQGPASVILIASLIDNPTNLGGLSRISESFGLESMYINDHKKIGHKDFKATSVTSEKHFPIHELKEMDVPQFLLTSKRYGYTVVGIEQTDRSAILGQGVDENEMGQENRRAIGLLPKKCVLVLGSEKEGISAEVLAVIDRCVEIKTVGVTRSLNVQTAGGIALYEWWRKWGEEIK